MVSRHTDRNNSTQPIKVMSNRLESDGCPFVRGANNLLNVRTMASITEDLFPPAINDFRPRNVNKINTLENKFNFKYASHKIRSHYLITDFSCAKWVNKKNIKYVYANTYHQINKNKLSYKILILKRKEKIYVFAK